MIIDSHTHILPPDIIKRKDHYADKDLTFKTLFTAKNSTMATAETLITTMDQQEISSAAVFGMGWKVDRLVIEGLCRRRGQCAPSIEGHCIHSSPSAAWLQWLAHVSAAAMHREGYAADAFIFILIR